MDGIYSNLNRQAVGCYLLDVAFIDSEKPLLFSPKSFFNSNHIKQSDENLPWHSSGAVGFCTVVRNNLFD